MKKLAILLVVVLSITGCRNHNNAVKRVPVAKAGNTILYLDQLPRMIKPETDADSIAVINNYINKWGKKEILYQKAEENLTQEQKDEIEAQLEETRHNLVVYEYQRKMILEKMDTVLSEAELENYYYANEKTFILTSNIVKALYIKLPLETPDINKIRQLVHSINQTDFLQLENLCYQFADKFDDFNEEWIPLNRLTVELHEEIENEENFLRRNSYYESSDSLYLYIISIRDYRLISTLAPYEYVKDDIKRVVWNNRRYNFIQTLEDGIFDEALKENNFNTYNN